MKFRLHCLGLPHTKTNEDFTACAYTQKVLKFCKMMTERGHHVIHYGTAGSNPICTENVTVLSNKTWDKVYGHVDYKKGFFQYDLNDMAYREFYTRAIGAIMERKQPNDFILPFWGSGARAICDAHNDLIVVEPGIGYPWGIWAPYKVFESYALYHAYLGLPHVERCGMDFYEVVIPNYFDLKDFEFSDQKEDYMLFVGRVFDGKGVNVAIDVTGRLGIKLKVAGQCDDFYQSYDWPDHVEYVGYVGIEERKELMKNAMGSYLPSMYLEPFGGVQIENLLSGTPTITSDWGGFTENNINGVTGYRCRTFGDFVEATRNVINGEISYSACREHGEKFSLEAIAPRYEKFFQDIMNVRTGDGWYQV